MHRPKAASSQLPSLIMPCPVCTGRLVFQTVTPTKPPSELEDHVHACERCGTQVIRMLERLPRQKMATGDFSAMFELATNNMV